MRTGQELEERDHGRWKKKAGSRSWNTSEPPNGAPNPKEGI